MAEIEFRDIHKSFGEGDARVEAHTFRRNGGYYGKEWFWKIHSFKHNGWSYDNG